MNTVPFASRNTDAITLPAEKTTTAFFGGVIQDDSSASIVVWSLVQNSVSNTHPDLENGQENSLNLFQK